MAVNPIIKFLNAARSLAKQGMSKEAIEQFARNEFGEIGELFQKQIDIIFKRPASGIEKITLKDEVFDDTVTKLPYDDQGFPFNPKDPLKNVKKQTEGIETISLEERMDRIKGTSKKLDEAIKEYEEIYKPKKPEDKATGGRAGYQTGNQVTPQVDPRMNLDYNTLLAQNQAQRAIQAQNRNPGIMRPTMADVSGAVKTDPRAGIQEAFLNERLTTGPSQGQLLTSVMPDFDRYGTYTGDDQLIRDYAAAGRGTPTSQLVKFSESNPYAVSGPGYYEYDGTSFTKTADLNMTPEYEKFIRSNYGLGQINQTTVPRKITQDDMDTANFFGPMYTGFDYSQSTNWSPGQPAPEGYRVVNMMGDQFLERMYPSKEEVAGLPMGPMGMPGMMPPMMNDPYEGLSGQEYAEKYGIPYALGGRAGYYTGGMVDVEPNLSDIGHGSDALMARTRLVAPDNQATTSTGLNYLLAEDNDNIRVPFSKGKIAKEILDKGRRGFMKVAGGIGAGIAGLKTGLLGLGEKAAPVVEKVAETVSTSAQEVPPYFLNLVKKIKNLGEETLASQDKATAKKYKDYVMEEDFAGNITIIKKDMNNPYPEEVIMSYKVDDVSLPSGKGMAKVDEYEEFTVRPDKEGKMKDVEGGVPDEVIEEGTMVEDNMTDFGKADGGRIGFSKGKLAFENVSKFLQKVFGKQNMEEMPNRDPEMYQGILEVVDMFRNRDKEGLIKYMRKFLPHKNDAEIEEFIIGDEGIDDIQGQLIRLGSGRDYKAKIDMIKKSDEIGKLRDLEVTEEMIRKPNASGGLAKLLGE